MRMRGASIHLELLQHGTTQTILGKHTTDGVHQHVGRLLSKELVERSFTQTAHIAGMMVILFIFQLLFSCFLFISLFIIVINILRRFS